MIGRMDALEVSANARTPTTPGGQPGAGVAAPDQPRWTALEARALIGAARRAGGAFALGGAFEPLDPSCSGFVSRVDFVRGLRTCGTGLAEGYLQHVAAAMDAGDTGFVNYEAFLLALQHAPHPRDLPDDPGARTHLPAGPPPAPPSDRGAAAPAGGISKWNPGAAAPEPEAAPPAGGILKWNRGGAASGPGAASPASGILKWSGSGAAPGAQGPALSWSLESGEIAGEPFRLSDGEVLLRAPPPSASPAAPPPPAAVSPTPAGPDARPLSPASSLASGPDSSAPSPRGPLLLSRGGSPAALHAGLRLDRGSQCADALFARCAPSLDGTVASADVLKALSAMDAAALEPLGLSPATLTGTFAAAFLAIGKVRRAHEAPDEVDAPQRAEESRIDREDLRDFVLTMRAARRRTMPDSAVAEEDSEESSVPALEQPMADAAEQGGGESDGAAPDREIFRERGLRNSAEPRTTRRATRKKAEGLEDLARRHYPHPSERAGPREGRW